MTVPKEAWLFDSHKSSKRSQWLQSTLSELEDKTKGILKLIEGDADTFAQRAEMYYMKRPELVNMIEDFYRAYRSLAEKHDQLKMESGDTFSNRGLFFKEWNSPDKSFESPSVVSEDMVSEVEDPDSEDVQVESRLRELEVPKKNNGDLAMLTNEVGLKGRVKENLYDLFTDPVDSMWEVGYPKSEAAENRSKLREFPEKMSNYGDIYTMTEEVKHIDGEVSNIADKFSKGSEFVQVEPDVDCNSKDLLEEAGKNKLLSLLIKETGTICTNTNSTAEVSSEHFISSSEELKAYHPELGEARDESKLRVVLEKKRDSDVAKLMSQVEKLQNENVIFMAELARKDEEKREIIRQLSLSMDMLRQENVTFMTELARKDEEKREVIRQLSLFMDMLRQENVSLRKSVNESNIKGGLFTKQLKNLKGIFGGKLFGSHHSKYQTTLVAL